MHEIGDLLQVKMCSRHSKQVLEYLYALCFIVHKKVMIIFYYDENYIDCSLILTT